MEVDLPLADCGQRDPGPAADVGASGGSVTQPQGPSCEFPTLVLHRICKFATQRELKNYRLVSKDWNHIVASHPRYYETPIKLGRGWGLNAEVLDQCSLTKWTNIKFRYFNFNKQPYIRIFWPQVADFVQTLRLEHLSIKCHDLANLINSCTRLESLVLKAVSVTPVYEPDPPDRDASGRPVPQPDAAENEQPQPKRFIYCDHSQQANGAKRFQPAQQNGGPTIKSLEIYEQDTLPICVLQVLRDRCRGFLNSFNFEDCPLRGNVMFSPDTNTMMELLANILQDSQAELKSFSFLNNATGDRLLHLLADHARFQLTLQEFAVHIEPANARREGRHVPGISAQILDILRRLQYTNTVNSVAIAMIMSQDFLTHLEQILRNTPSLRKLAISFYVQDDNHNNLPLHLVLPNLAQVEDLTIEDAELLKAPYVTHWQFQNHLNYNYVNHLPPALTSLTLYHYWPSRHDPNNQDSMNALLQHMRIRNLTKFEVQESEIFHDGSMTTVIQFMRQLQELNVIKCVGLTDAGLTGLSDDTCRALASCNGQALMGSGNLLVGTRWCLAQLTDLKRISFHGCVKITDVSIRYGIYLPKLQSLDLTECANISDIGLSWLAQGNPSLEVLTLRHIHRISRHGVNLFLNQHRTIKKIYASETCANRSTEPHIYMEHPLFGDIVDAARIRKSPEEHRLARRYRNPHRRWRRRW